MSYGHENMSGYQIRSANRGFGWTNKGALEDTQGEFKREIECN